MYQKIRHSVTGTHPAMTASCWWPAGTVDTRYWSSEYVSQGSCNLQKKVVGCHYWCVSCQTARIRHPI